MAELRPVYATAATLTISGLGSLANSTSVTSSAVNNTADLFLDVLLEVLIATDTGATATGFIEIWAKGSIDGTDFDDDANDKLLGTVNLITAGAATRKRVLSIASAFGGLLPPQWQIRVRNVSGGALAASGSSISYRGVKAQSI